ncbi:putative arsenite inducuble rna associated protein aip-1 [Fasciola gigantica]|uniref:Putative arsenite inducuble rna associated protein aip-1 n=1 Tax=Fasciola gigantica TaxID=46835 RepID=A0A504YUE0_FASGI|nr:putative arsenite inducuble rna associated protein aip-1 [Fasciola gigantica]
MFSQLTPHLDFLPVKCGGCGRLFCKDHYPYDSHACSNPGLRDKQVPVCPLCNAVVPLRPGELPDVRVGHHIDTACQSKPALELKGKIFSNACSFPRCKKREVVACHCERCGMNFCMGHRNELDHQCQGVQQNNVGSHGRLSAAGAAAIFRAVFKNQRTTPSLNNHNDASFIPPPSRLVEQDSAARSDVARQLQEEEDRQLAIALSESLRESNRSQRRPTSGESFCTMS